MKTLTVLAKEWFDKVNGNSYFSAEVLADNKRVLVIPFQYGYGDHYKTVAMRALMVAGIFKDIEQYDNGGMEALWQYCKRHKIELLARKEENCKKRDLFNSAEADKINAELFPELRGHLNFSF